jgi:Tfp pilus assembly protein PilF
VNPFYTRPATIAIPALDYSVPIRIPAADSRESIQDMVRSERAIQRFDDARESFRRGDYARANDLIDESIALLPSDPALHQFRALVLFARHRYSEASAVIYSVLAVAPGWDWETINRLYDDPNRYEEHLRDLIRHVRTRPAADAQFLLAYHCMVIGEWAAAEEQLEQVLAANPTDRVTRNMLAAVRAQASE